MVNIWFKYRPRASNDSLEPAPTISLCFCPVFLTTFFWKGFAKRLYLRRAFKPNSESNDWRSRGFHRLPNGNDRSGNYRNETCNLCKWKRTPFEVIVLNINLVIDAGTSRNNGYLNLNHKERSLCILFDSTLS